MSPGITDLPAVHVPNSLQNAFEEEDKMNFIASQILSRCMSAHIMCDKWEVPRKLLLHSSMIGFEENTSVII